MRLLALPISLLAIACMAQSTTKLTASKANDYGLAYTLPTTVLDITIESEFTERTPGEFYNYANRNLNISDAIISPSKSSRVRSVTIVPRGEANPANRWLMQFKNGQGVYFILNDAGIPLAINTDNAQFPTTPELPVSQAASPTPLETPAAKQAVTQEMTLSSSMSSRAALATERIFELRQNRNDLISGQADNTPPDGKSMQLALDNLAAQEAALTAMFAGTEKIWTEVNTITFVPDSAEARNIIIARLSSEEGLVDADDLSGEPIYLSVQILTTGKMPLDEKGEPRAFPKNGVAYNIPGSALITISFRGALLTSQQVDLSQLGITFGLDPKIFTDKKAPASVTFNPSTGSITTLSIKE